MATIKNEKIISGTVNGASVTYTETIKARHEVSVQVTYSGTTITGEAKLQASLNGVNFVDIENSTNEFTDNSGSFLWNIADMNYNHLKVVCTSTTGDVTFEAWVLIKRPQKTE